ncbi:MAG: DUF4878 domain-containing protein [Aquabacterium sp.]|nr:DUF4878 domain-containing protein [Ferruginibacter sp.]
MKKIFAVAGLLIAFYSCNTSNTGSPKGTVNSFIEASKTGNIEEIKKYITKSDAGMLEIGESFLAKLDPKGAQNMKDKMAQQFKEKTKDATIEIKDEKIDGDNAIVNVAFAYKGHSETRPFSLVKEDGVWKVSLISTGMKNAGSNESEVQKTMKDMNLDSLQNAIGEGMKELNNMNKDSLKVMMEQGMKEFNKIDKDSLKKAMDQGMKALEKLKDQPKKN